MAIYNHLITWLILGGGIPKDLLGSFVMGHVLSLEKEANTLEKTQQSIYV